MHKEGGDEITTCAISHLRYKNTTLLLDGLKFRLKMTKETFAATNDETMLAVKDQVLKNFEKMRRKFEAHIKKYPVKDSKQCPQWVKRST